MLTVNVPIVVIGLVLLMVGLCLFGPALLEKIARLARIGGRASRSPSAARRTIDEAASTPAFEPHRWATRADAEEGLL